MNNCIGFPIEHVIVLMLENRSYDHMLGYLPNGHGLAGDEFNLVDQSVPTSERVHVSNRSGYVTVVDPEEAGRHRALLRSDALEKWRQCEVEQAEMSLEPLSTFQQAVVGLADLLNKKARRKPRAAQIQTEHEAAVHILESLAHFVNPRPENQVKP